MFFRLISEHKVLASIIAVILVLSIIIAITYSFGIGPFGKAVSHGYSSASKPLTGIRLSIYNITHAGDLADENARLKEEIGRLERELNAAQLSENELAELRYLSGALNYTAVHEEYAAVAATVTNMNRSDSFNIFTVDAGTEKGIATGDIVTSGNYLVGQVIETGKGYSKIRSIVDEDGAVSFQVARDISVLGIVHGNGNGKLSGYVFKSNMGVLEGDIVITTGIGSFPEGIEIGRVEETVFDNDSQMMNVTIVPSADFTNLRKVTVLVHHEV